LLMGVQDTRGGEAGTRWEMQIPACGNTAAIFHQ
jgi:hypothetical protein